MLGLEQQVAGGNVLGKQGNDQAHDLAWHSCGQQGDTDWIVPDDPKTFWSQ